MEFNEMKNKEKCYIILHKGKKVFDGVYTTNPATNPGKKTLKLLLSYLIKAHGYEQSDLEVFTGEITEMRYIKTKLKIKI